jgi:transposase
MFCNIYDINSSKIYSCKHCGMVADRDCNGAKNILMKGVLSN